LTLSFPREMEGANFFATRFMQDYAFIRVTAIRFSLFAAAWRMDPS
jgi:hypothetical protein